MQSFARRWSSEPRPTPRCVSRAPREISRLCVSQRPLGSNPPLWHPFSSPIETPRPLSERLASRVENFLNTKRPFQWPPVKYATRALLNDVACVELCFIAEWSIRRKIGRGNKSLKKKTNRTYGRSPRLRSARARDAVVRGRGSVAFQHHLCVRF